jgi:hypothetical protein
LPPETNPCALEELAGFFPVLLPILPFRLIIVVTLSCYLGQLEQGERAFVPRFKGQWMFRNQLSKRVNGLLDEVFVPGSGQLLRMR